MRSDDGIDTGDYDGETKTLTLPPGRVETAFGRSVGGRSLSVVPALHDRLRFECVRERSESCTTGEGPRAMPLVGKLGGNLCKGFSGLQAGRLVESRECSIPQFRIPTLCCAWHHHNWKQKQA